VVGGEGSLVTKMEKAEEQRKGEKIGKGTERTFYPLAFSL